MGSTLPHVQAEEALPPASRRGFEVSVTGPISEFPPSQRAIIRAFLFTPELIKHATILLLQWDGLALSHVSTAQPASTVPMSNTAKSKRSAALCVI